MRAVVVKVASSGEVSYEFSPDTQRLLVTVPAESGSVVLDLTRQAALDLAEKIVARTGQMDPALPTQREEQARKSRAEQTAQMFRKELR